MLESFSLRSFCALEIRIALRIQLGSQPDARQEALQLNAQRSSQLEGYPLVRSGFNLISDQLFFALTEMCF